MPRHRTSSPFCVACRLRAGVCVCPEAPRLPLATRLILVVHQSEWAKRANTGHLTRLAVRGADVRRQGLPGRPVSSEGVDPLAPSTLALYPGRGAVPLTAAYLAALGGPVTLLVPDGNWMQAKNMMRRVPMLRAARAVRLEGPGFDLPHLRRNGEPGRCSTFEAVARALGVLEGRAVEERLLAFFRRYLERKNAN